MLQAYAIENLRPGMRVGRDVFGESGEVLLSKGQVLTRDNICNLLERPIFSVYIDESDKVVDIPGREHLLDEDYVTWYEKTYDKVERLLQGVAQNGKLDSFLLWEIVEVISRELASDGSKAIPHIHNMDMEGEYLFHHSLHVGILAALMGNWLEWGKHRREELIVAGLLHDVGKLKISKEVLDKTEALTDEEFALIQQHTEYGVNMLENAGEKRAEVLAGVAQHHERGDGTGYPLRLTRADISDFGRIIAFLDIYDAMASNRAYARKNSPFDAFAAIGDDMKTGKLDPEFSVQFIRNTNRAMIGAWVELTNGVRGRIVYIPESRIMALPMVQTVHDEFIDLENRLDIKIKAILTAKELQA